jgi:dihydropteroate synthase
MKSADLARAAERLRSIGDDMMAAPSREAFLQALCRLRVLEREMRLAADAAASAISTGPIVRARLVVHDGGRRA